GRVWLGADIGLGEAVEHVRRDLEYARRGAARLLGLSCHGFLCLGCLSFGGQSSTKCRSLQCDGPMACTIRERCLQFRPSWPPFPSRTSARPFTAPAATFMP